MPPALVLAEADALEPQIAYTMIGLWILIQPITDIRP
jgi:hypothetical protein